MCLYYLIKQASIYIYIYIYAHAHTHTEDVMGQLFELHKNENKIDISLY